MKFLFLLFVTPLFAFPTDSSKSDFELQNLKFLEDFVFQETSTNKTDALLILKNDKIIYERYERDYSQSTRHHGWSTTKTILGLLVGIAIEKKLLTLDEEVAPYFSNHPNLKGVTVRNLLNMSSGLDWKESYEESFLNSSVVGLLYRSAGIKNMEGFILSHNLKYPPGKRFYYSSGDSNLLSIVLQKKLSKIDYDNMPWDWLFNPLEIKSAVLEQSPTGNFVGSSYFHGTPRDFLTLGYLILKKGNYFGKQIVNESFIEFMSTLTPSYTNKTYPSIDGPYGAHLWLNVAAPTSPYPCAPPDMVFMSGHQGQIVASIPSKDMVIVRLAEDKNDGMNKKDFFCLLVKSLK